MDKLEFLDSISQFYNEIKNNITVINAITSNRIQSQTVLLPLEKLSSRWYEEFEPILRKLEYIDQKAIEKYHDNFAKILNSVSKRPSKSNTLEILKDLEKIFNANFLIPLKKNPHFISRNNSLKKYLKGLEGLEFEYLNEAIECANIEKYRAALMLGWCAAINRIHKIIEKTDFEKFNKASESLSAITTGRYKRYNKKFQIQNLSDLRMTVFDNDLLWVIEFMGLIDGNEHEKLEICFTYRNICSHPGDAKVTPENVDSFFSDIDQLIFNNPKFALI